ncbi:MAG TPA: hypothetical protein VES73_06285, partial [Lamprocystis sp. (in: g-proteobacteria)]|nr:hypothetical protein [Lamprocystis sp. (in: g-proteobacteria)]
TAPVAHDRPGPRLLAWLSQVAALALVAAGLLGLLGFLNLAWAIAINLGWLALVAALLYLTGGALDDLFNVAARRLPAMAAAWGLRRRWG